MRLEDLSEATEGTFFRCLHDERPDDPRVLEIRKRWHSDHQPLGLRSKVLVTDSGEVAGLCQYLPIEHSHLLGRDLMAILCIWVHGYDHHIGNRQGRGYGRFILESIEEDARESGFSGVAVWGKDFPYWNPVSFYEHMGYRRADQDGYDVLVWKPFSEDAEPPSLLRPVPVAETSPDRVSIVSLCTGWCGGCSFNLIARDVAEALGDRVEFTEVDTSVPGNRLRWGISDGILLEGELYRHDGPPFDEEELRTEVERLFLEKTSR